MIAIAAPRTAGWRARPRNRSKPATAAPRATRAAISRYGPGRFQSVRPTEWEKSLMARLTATFASRERRTAKTAQRTAMRSQNGPVVAATAEPRVREAAKAIAAHAA